MCLEKNIVYQVYQCNVRWTFNILVWIYVTIGFFNETAVWINTSAIVLLLGLLLAQSQDVFQPIESYLNDLRVHHRQQVTQGLNAAQVHQISI